MSQFRDAPEAAITEWWKRYTEKQMSAGDHELRVFVRSLRPPPGSHTQRERIFEMLRTATDKERVDSFDVRVTGDELCLCDRCKGLTPGGTVREDVLELAEWGRAEPEPSGFERRDVSCSFTGEEYRVLVPPETTLGIYLDDSLAGVFPCTADGTQYSIETFLDSLVEGNPPTHSSLAPEQVHHLTS